MGNKRCGDVVGSVPKSPRPDAYEVFHYEHGDTVDVIVTLTGHITRTEAIDIAHIIAERGTPGGTVAIIGPDPRINAVPILWHGLETALQNNTKIGTFILKTVILDMALDDILPINATTLIVNDCIGFEIGDVFDKKNLSKIVIDNSGIIARDLTDAIISNVPITTTPETALDVTVRSIHATDSDIERLSAFHIVAAESRPLLKMSLGAIDGDGQAIPWKKQSDIDPGHIADIKRAFIGRTRPFE